MKAKRQKVLVHRAQAGLDALEDVDEDIIVTNHGDACFYRNGRLVVAYAAGEWFKIQDVSK